MKTLSSKVLLFNMILLMMALSACGSKSAPIETAIPDKSPSSQTTSAPIIASTQEQESSAMAVIPCDKLIPTDELDLLLNKMPATLTEKTLPGETTCAWQYKSTSGESGQFRISANFSNASVETWKQEKEAELATLPSDLVVIQIDGLGDENYVWTSKPDNQQAVYVRKGSQTLIMHFNAADLLYLGNESGIIDMSDRIFGRLGS